MSDDPGERQFSEREVARILKTAVVLQERRGAAAAARGLSLAQLEEIAAEAGLDPALVRQAVAELDGAAGPGDEVNPFLGAPHTIVVERVVSGVIDERASEALLDTVRSVSSEVGQVSTLGRAFGWRGRLRGAKTDVSVSPRETQTVVRVRVALDEVALGHFMVIGVVGGGAGGLFTLGMLLGPLGLAALAAGAGVAGSAYLTARLTYARQVRRYRGHASALADQLAARVAELVRAASTSLPARTGAPALAAPDPRAIPPAGPAA